MPSTHTHQNHDIVDHYSASAQATHNNAIHHAVANPTQSGQAHTGTSSTATAGGAGVGTLGPATQVLASPLPANSRHFQGTQARDTNWGDLITQACGPVRGPAVQALAHHLSAQAPGQGLDAVVSFWLSIELLQHESLSTCETLTVLLSQEWSGTTGELLAASRTL